MAANYYKIMCPTLKLHVQFIIWKLVSNQMRNSKTKAERTTRTDAELKRRSVMFLIKNNSELALLPELAGSAGCFNQFLEILSRFKKDTYILSV
jgi:hypothetical protein